MCGKCDLSSFELQLLVKLLGRGYKKLKPNYFDYLICGRVLFSDACIHEIAEKEKYRHSWANSFTFPPISFITPTPCFTLCLLSLSLHLSHQLLLINPTPSSNSPSPHPHLHLSLALSPSLNFFLNLSLLQNGLNYYPKKALFHWRRWWPCFSCWHGGWFLWI